MQYTEASTDASWPDMKACHCHSFISLSLTYTMSVILSLLFKSFLFPDFVTLTASSTGHRVKTTNMSDDFSTERPAGDSGHFCPIWQWRTTTEGGMKMWCVTNPETLSRTIATKKHWELQNDTSSITVFPHLSLCSDLALPRAPCVFLQQLGWEDATLGRSVRASGCLLLHLNIPVFSTDPPEAHTVVHPLHCWGGGKRTQWVVCVWECMCVSLIAKFTCRERPLTVTWVHVPAGTCWSFSASAVSGLRVLLQSDNPLVWSCYLLLTTLAPTEPPPAADPPPPEGGSVRTQGHKLTHILQYVELKSIIW